ncbi:MAG: 6-bladed beta-propeller [Gemmatimonadetes bacterium]|nr:6-bladed beta-propeller [Candidatus Palauibacter rhopaloidicola]
MTDAASPSPKPRWSRGSIPWVAVPLCAAILPWVAACTDGEAPQPGVDVPMFEGTVDLEIGELDGDEAYLFSRIASVAEDPLGRVLVVDREVSEVRVFDSGGAFLFRLGGEGDGPEEFRGPCCLGFSPEGELWVRQAARYTAFELGDAAATYLRVQRRPFGGQGGAAPVTFDAEGRLVDIGSLRSSGEPFVHGRVHVNEDGSADTVVLREPEAAAEGHRTVVVDMSGFAEGFSGTAQLYLYQPYGPLWLRAHAPGGAWASASRSLYAVELHAADGSMTEIIGPPDPGPPLSPEEREYAQSRLERDMERGNLDEPAFEIPERKGPVADIFFDQAGRLWVEKAAADGAEMVEADVYEGAALVARYRWPSRVDPGAVPWATGTALYGVTTDELGVERAARVRFERRP